MLVNWLRNFYTNSNIDDQFFLFYLPLFYSSSVCLYFGFFDDNNHHFLIAKIINLIVFGILEQFKLTNISFFPYIIFLINFWITIYFVNKKVNSKFNEIKVKSNEINSETNRGKKNDSLNINNSEANRGHNVDSLNINNGHLVVNLKEAKREIIKEEFNEFLLKS